MLFKICVLVSLNFDLKKSKDFVKERAYSLYSLKNTYGCYFTFMRLQIDSTLRQVTVLSSNM